MKSKVEHPKVPKSKPNEKDDLKTLSMPELEKKLGVFAGRTYSSRGTETTDPIWA